MIAGAPDEVTPFSWTGLVADPTGLYHARARYYDPEAGRFLSEDVIPASNRYLYANANPVNFVDPTGLSAAVDYLEGLGMENVRAHERELTAYTLDRLTEVPGLRVFGPPPSPDRLGPVSFEIEGVHGHDIAEILDRHGVAVRAGHHCAQPLMERLGVAATARASFGVYTPAAEIDRLVEGLDDARRRFGYSSAGAVRPRRAPSPRAPASRAPTDRASEKPPLPRPGLRGRKSPPPPPAPASLSISDGVP